VIFGSTTPASRPADPGRRLKSRPSGVHARSGSRASGLTRSPRPRSPPIRSADPVPSPRSVRRNLKAVKANRLNHKTWDPFLNKLSQPTGARLAECASVWKRRPATLRQAGTYLGRPQHEIVNSLCTGPMRCPGHGQTAE
jgi:hypothetical protein